MVVNFTFPPPPRHRCLPAWNWELQKEGSQRNCLVLGREVGKETLKLREIENLHFSSPFLHLLVSHTSGNPTLSVTVAKKSATCRGRNSDERLELLSQLDRAVVPRKWDQTHCFFSFSLFSRLCTAITEVRVPGHRA